MVDAARLPPLIASLLRPEAYPHPAGEIMLVQTHVSFILLAGEHAYKIKKPVDMGFLNFVSLDDREYFCRRELALNQRLCPGIYRQVVPITGADGHVRIGGAGPVVEWAVQMRRLPSERMLPALLDAGAVTVADTSRIADRLAAFHAVAATNPAIAAFGEPAAIRRNIDENFAQLAPFVGELLPAGHDRWLAQAADAFLRDHPGLFADRIRRHRIRDCHGDVHAGSICLTDDVTIFDCIEFNDRFRFGDVAADVAFLAMDLDHHGRADLAWEFVTAYERAAGDYGLASVLDFYKTYRAVVRAKVESLRSSQASISALDHNAARSAAREYFDLAFAYAGGVARPVLLITCGLMGTGKTALAGALARRLALVHLPGDAVRKRLAGLQPTDHAYADFGQGLYGPEMSRRTYAALLRSAYTWLARGCSVIIDASFKRSDERERARALAASLEVPFAVIECTCPPDIVRQRVTERLAAARTISDARWEHYAAQAADFDVVTDMAPNQHLVVDTTASLDDCAASVRTWLTSEVGRWQHEPIRSGRGVPSLNNAH